MQIPATSRQYVYIGVNPPPGIPDVTVYAAEVALVPDNGAEPLDGDYHAALWINGEAALLVGPTALVYAPGDFMAFARITAGAERPVLRSGRVRIGGSGN